MILTDFCLTYAGTEGSSSIVLAVELTKDRFKRAVYAALKYMSNILKMECSEFLINHRIARSELVSVFSEYISILSDPILRKDLFERMWRWLGVYDVSINRSLQVRFGLLSRNVSELQSIFHQSEASGDIHGMIESYESMTSICHDRQLLASLHAVIRSRKPDYEYPYEEKIADLIVDEKFSFGFFLRKWMSRPLKNHQTIINLHRLALSLFRNKQYARAQIYIELAISLLSDMGLMKTMSYYVFLETWQCCELNSIPYYIGMLRRGGIFSTSQMLSCLREASPSHYHETKYNALMLFYVHRTLSGFSRTFESGIKLCGSIGDEKMIDYYLALTYANAHKFTEANVHFNLQMQVDNSNTFLTEYAIFLLIHRDNIREERRAITFLEQVISQEEEDDLLYFSNDRGLLPKELQDGLLLDENDVAVFSTKALAYYGLIRLNAKSIKIYIEKLRDYVYTSNRHGTTLHILNVVSPLDGVEIYRDTVVLEKIRCSVIEKEEAENELYLRKSELAHLSFFNIFLQGYSTEKYEKIRRELILLQSSEMNMYRRTYPMTNNTSAVGVVEDIRHDRPCCVPFRTCVVS